MPPVADPVAVLRSRRYHALIVVTAIIGVLVSAVAWGFLALVSKLQGWLFTSLPSGLGFHREPVWWPLPLLGLAGLLVGLTIRYLPGTGGHSPADGLQPGSPTPAQLPGVFLAALATLSLGAVLGPEAPLIALGGGLAAALVRLSRRPVPASATTVVAGAGAFAAISTLLGSPIVGAFLVMETAGLSGASLELVMLPGLLASGVGALIFVGLGAWSGLGTFALGIPHLPHFAHPDVAEFGWAFVIGFAAAVAGVGMRRLALAVRPRVEPRLVWATPVIGLAVAGLAIAYAEGTGKASSEVLFSGQTATGPLIVNASAYTVPALLLLLACKGLAYSLSLSAFRGGPIFPSLFLGAAGGVAMSHLPGLPLIPAVAMGMGALSVVMLRLPLTAVLLATLLLFSDGVAVMPLVIVAVVVAYLASLRIAPASWSLPGTATATPAEGPRDASRLADAGAPGRRAVVLLPGVRRGGGRRLALVQPVPDHLAGSHLRLPQPVPDRGERGSSAGDHAAQPDQAGRADHCGPGDHRWLVTVDRDRAGRLLVASHLVLPRRVVRPCRHAFPHRRGFDHPQRVT